MSKWFYSILAIAPIHSIFAEYGLNMTPGVTDISKSVYDLHMLVLWVCVAIGVVVFGAIIYSIIFHRKSKGYKAASFHESTAVEVIWTVVPFIILVALAIPAAKTLIAMETTGDADMTVKITGYQWKWQYEYLDGEAKGVNFFSSLSTPRDQIEGGKNKGENYLLEVDNHFVIPTGRKVRFLLTANDVLHAWWVPALAVKKDAVPGFINEMWVNVNEAGTYRGQCAELCGKDHGFMPIVVDAVSDEDFKAWADNQKVAMAEVSASSDKDWSMDDLVAKGEEVYSKSCAACHQAGGGGLPGVFPAITGSPVATGSLEGHIDIVMNGKPGTAMQAFAAQLSDVDLAAVITYQRNGLGNAIGDKADPKAIKSAR